MWHVMLHVALKLHKVLAFSDITSLLERCLRQPGASFDQTTLGKPCSNAGCFKEPERWFKASCTKSPNRVVALSDSQIWCKEKFGASCCAKMAPRVGLFHVTGYTANPLDCVIAQDACGGASAYFMLALHHSIIHRGFGVLRAPGGTL